VCKRDGILTAIVDHCGELKAEAFPKGRGSLHEDIVAVEGSHYDVALVRPSLTRLAGNGKSPWTAHRNECLLN